MIEENTYFYSDGIKLDASYFYPDSYQDGVEAKQDAKEPIIIMCSGFLGLKNIHPARFARGLTDLRFTLFGFDYRGFAESEGERGKVLIEDQVSDIANAVSFVSRKAKEQKRKLFLAGWGMAGGMILDALRLVDGVSGLIIMNGFFNAIRVQKALRGKNGWKKFYKYFKQQRAEYTATGEVKNIDPFDVYPLDKKSRQYVDDVLYKNPDFGLKYVWHRFGDSLLQFEPESNMEHLKETPVFIAHGEKNALHPPEEAKALHKKYPGDKELYWMKHAGHTEWMFDENKTFVMLVGNLDRWLERHT